MYQHSQGGSRRVFAGACRLKVSKVVGREDWPPQRWTAENVGAQKGCASWSLQGAGVRQGGDPKTTQLDCRMMQYEGVYIRLLHAIGEPFVPWASGIESKFNSKKVEGKQLGQTLKTLRKGLQLLRWAQWENEKGENGKSLLQWSCCPSFTSFRSGRETNIEKIIYVVLSQQTWQTEVGLLDAERHFQRQDTRKHLGAFLALSVTVVGRAIHTAMPAPVGDPRNLQGMMPQESLVEVVLLFESLRWEWGDWWPF